MDKTKQDKIQRFLNDEVMASAVYEIILKAFLEPYGQKNDVQVLAASRIAIDLLDEAWKKLNRFSAEDVGEVGAKRQVGL